MGRKIAVLGSKFRFNQLELISVNMNLLHVQKASDIHGKELTDIIYLSDWKREYKNPDELGQLIKSRLKK